MTSFADNTGYGERYTPHRASVARYVHGRCRCQPCRAAHNAYQRAARLRREQALADAGGQGPMHGTESTYVNWRCRCEPCTTAHTIAAARWRNGSAA